MAIFSPYYYGKHKWDNYLLDIQRTIKSTNAGDRESIWLQPDVVHEQFEELRHQTEQLRHIERALENGLEELRAEFEWGFSLMVDRMDTQIKHLSQIAASLDAIHKTLPSHILTQARELFQLGQEHRRKGLIAKAIESYLKAEQKNDVDFPLQFQIGKLFLYGRDGDDNVIDLPQAEKHLLLAACYADADKSMFPLSNDYCGQAYFHAAIAAYLIGEQEQAAGHSDSMRSCLERALGYLAKAQILWPRFTEIVYTQAKCYALLGNKQEALERFQILSDRDRRYCAKASQDADFTAFASEIKGLFRRACTYPGSLALAVSASLEKAQETFPWVKLGNAGGSLSDAIEQELTAIGRVLPTLDADLEGLHRRTNEQRKALEALAEDGLAAQVNKHAAELKSLDSNIVDARDAIELLKWQLKETIGGYTGCFFMLLTCGIAAFFGNRLGGNPMIILSLIVGVIICFPVYHLVNRFAPSRPESRIRNEIDQKLGEIELSEEQSRISKEGLAKAQQQLARFRSWRDCKASGNTSSGR
jgi:tetratricopeptide (TPR) repeat protein